jgi:lipooligosaccharide transport system permease protein
MVYGRYFGLRDRDIAARIPRLLEFAGLEPRADARIQTLSGGMKRRLSLARALVNDPDLIFLDEPTTGLDPQARHLIWERLKRLLAQGKTILLTTHFMDEAERLCHRVAVMDRGRLIAEGSPRELIARHIEPQVLEVYGDGPASWARTKGASCASAARKRARRCSVIRTMETACWRPLTDAMICGTCIGVPTSRTSSSSSLDAICATEMRAKDVSAPRITTRFSQVWRRNFLVWRKLAITSMLGNLADPMLYMLGLGYGLGSLLPRSAACPITFLAAGTVCYSTMNSATFEALYSAFSRMHTQKTWDAILNTPMNLDDIVLAEALWAASKSLLSGSAILVIIWVMGLSHSLLTLWIIPLTILIGLAFGCLGLVMTALAPSYEFFLYFTLVIPDGIAVRRIFPVTQPVIPATVSPRYL